MRNGDVLYFSPRYKFIDLDFDGKSVTLDAFRDRVEGFYLGPAENLKSDCDAFAVGLLCVSTIDFLARLAFGPNTKVGERFVKWLRTNVKEFNVGNRASQFYDDFRCGLVHEGLIKNAGEFSYEFPDLVKSINGALMVNPRALLRAVKDSFQTYLKQLNSDDRAYSLFNSTMERDFEGDMKLAAR